MSKFFEDGEFVEFFFEDLIDLYFFQFCDIKEVVFVYFEEVVDLGFLEVCIIYGCGIGMQWQIVCKILECYEYVFFFCDVFVECGGWGVIIV